ncbi:MAG: hypothetical protein PWQ54_321 [Bacteroidales bacterium]|jgi:hypothetical protein|nr:hypothetical protein [Bacteroidales bacterium]
MLTAIFVLFIAEYEKKKDREFAFYYFGLR